MKAVLVLPKFEEGDLPGYGGGRPADSEYGAPGGRRRGRRETGGRH